VVLNYRGLNKTPIKNNRYLDLTTVEDIHLAVEHVEKQIAGSPLYMVGISMGANLGMRYLGEVKEDTPVKCMVAISNPFDLKATVDSLHNDWSKRIYSYYLAKRLVKNLKKSWHLLDQDYLAEKGVDIKRVEKAVTTRQFDEEFTIKFHGWTSASEYSQGMSSINFVGHIEKPVLVVNSKNDPISL
jgi:predicted alpha/beta-fold hydrolase